MNPIVYESQMGALDGYTAFLLGVQKPESI